MSNVVDLANWRKRPENPPPRTWSFDMSVYTTEYGHPEATIDFGGNADVERGEHLRLVARQLEALAFMIWQEAEQHSAGEHGQCLAQGFVFESGLVRVRVDDERLVTDEQAGWLDARWDDAKVAAKQKAGK